MPPTGPGYPPHPLWAFMDQPQFFPFSSPRAAREQANTNTNNGDEPPSGPESSARGGRRHRPYGLGRGGRHGHNRHGPRHGPSPGSFKPPALELFQHLASQVFPGANTRLVEQLWNNYQRAWNSHERQVDFTPRADVFATPEQFVVHVSLPGAKKEDINVNYNPGESTLQVSGVVLRPGIDEEMNSALVLDERGGEETGMFEREIAFGEKVRGEPANVDAEGISAKLVDGVLVVVLPRIPTEKKKVVVEDGSDVKENAAASTSASAAVDSEARPGTPDTTTAVPSTAPSTSAVHHAPAPDAMSVDTETEKGDAEDTTTQHSRQNLTPDDSEESDWEDGGKEFVKVDVKDE